MIQCSPVCVIGFVLTINEHGYFYELNGIRLEAKYSQKVCLYDVRVISEDEVDLSAVYIR